METIHPLIEALAHGNAVAFVGSGASAPAGLPLWRDFLKGLLRYAVKVSSNYSAGKSAAADDEWELTRQYLENGDYLLAAEMLQRGLPRPTFVRYVQQIFGGSRYPSDIHRAIARLPFKHVITTNFDTLLEAAYHPVHRGTFLWKDPGPIFDAIRQEQPAIIKLHGTVDNADSIRLTRTEYRDMTHDSPALNSCISSLLLWKTFLFVGYSLRDPDLLALIDEARVRFKGSFGPHYAILPKEEADAKLRSYLKESMGIHVLTYEPSDGAHAPEITKILRQVNGLVSRERISGDQLVDLGDPRFNRREATQTALEAIMGITGSLRGDICMIRSEDNPRLERIAKIRIDPADDLPREVLHDSVIGTTFYQTPGGDYIYLSDTSSVPAKAALKDAGYIDATYAECHRSVRSEFSCPISSDGRRIGVLNLESDLLSGYGSSPEYHSEGLPSASVSSKKRASDAYVEAVAALAEQLGAIYAAADRRQKVAGRLRRFYETPFKFRRFMHRDRLIRYWGLEFFLFEIDYLEGRLEGHSAVLNRNDGPFGFDFHQPSVARDVFLSGKPELIPDIMEELRKGDRSRLNSTGVNRFGKHGPLYECPLRAEGQTAAVLATWQAIPPKLPKGAPDDVWERVRRSANLLANDYDRNGQSSAETFADRVASEMMDWDAGLPWGLHLPRGQRKKKGNFKAGARQVLIDAVLDCSELRRVRLWQHIPSQIADEWVAQGKTRVPIGLVCIESASLSSSGLIARGEFVGRSSSRSNPYYRYLKSRFDRDPLARRQFAGMFGTPDYNVEDLSKDPEGSWIVAPIVHKGQLIGALAGDTHLDRKEQEVTPSQLSFQICAIDLVADMIRFVLPSHPQLPKHLPLGH